ncbi:MAG: hypothetical protein OHK005_11250 [Candidatus Methylacidiphilales bacterium]
MGFDVKMGQLDEGTREVGSKTLRGKKGEGEARFGLRRRCLGVMDSGVKRVWVWLAGEVKRLAELPDKPHSIALGTAAGVFIGFTPLYGLKTVLALALAFFIRGNKLAAVLVVNLYDVLFPLLPLIFDLQFRLGLWMLGRAGEPILEMKEFNLHQLLSWTTFFKVGEPLLVGSLVFGAVAAPVSYVIALRLVRSYHLSIGRNE